MSSLRCLCQNARSSEICNRVRGVERLRHASRCEHGARVRLASRLFRYGWKYQRWIDGRYGRNLFLHAADARTTLRCVLSESRYKPKPTRECY